MLHHKVIELFGPEQASVSLADDVLSVLVENSPFPIFVELVGLLNSVLENPIEFRAKGFLRSIPLVRETQRELASLLAFDCLKKIRSGFGSRLRTE